jgi:hypothetical protein
MNIVRFIFPFLFVRNWHDGSWELSRARLILTLLTLGIVVVGIGIAYVLQMPVVYEKTPL